MTDTVTRYDTATLDALVANLKRPRSALLDRYFPLEVTFDAETVLVDVEKGKRRIAPLVHPDVPSRVKEQNAIQTNAIRPAYTKEKVPFRPGEAFKRAIGEAVGTPLSPQERMDLRISSELRDMIAALQRRQELMASEAIRTGKLVLVGENYPTTTVDFQRAAALSVADLAGGARWTESTSKPLRDLKAWAKLVRQQSGVNPIDVIMGEDAFTEFSEHTTVIQRLDTRNVQGAQLTVGQQIAEGLTFQGVVDSFNIFSYSGWYADPLDNDTEKEIWPAKVVGMTAPGEEGLAGRRLYGAIQDMDVLQARAFYADTFDEKDPPKRFLRVQSAPLVVPYRVDATASVTVMS